MLRKLCFSIVLVFVVACSEQTAQQAILHQAVAIKTLMNAIYAAC